MRFELFLLENRIDWMKKNLGQIDSSHDTFAQHRNTNDIIDHFATHADPSKKKIYTQWILKQYQNKDIRQEDAERVRGALEGFERHKTQLPHQDINRYNISSLEDHVESLKDAAPVLSKNAQERQIKNDGAELIHKGPGITVHKIKTHEAARLYGAGTKWCTASTNPNQFNNYSKSGPLYVFQSHHGGQVEKYQLHIESNQFMDAKDKSASLDDLVQRHPSLREIPEFQGKKTVLTHPDAIEKHIPKLLETDMAGIAFHPKISEEHFENLYHSLPKIDPHKYNWEDTSKHGNFYASAKISDKFFKDKILDNPEARSDNSYQFGIPLYHYAANPNAKASHLHQLIDNIGESGSYDGRVINGLCANKKLPKEIHEKFTNKLLTMDQSHWHNYSYSVANFLGRADTDPKAVSQMVDHTNVHIRAIAASHWDRLNEHQKQKLIDDKDYSIKRNIIKEYDTGDYRKLPLEHQQQLIHDNEKDVRELMAKSPYLHPSIINDIMDRPFDANLKSRVIQTHHKKLTAQQVRSYSDKFNHPALAKNKHLLPHHVENFINSGNYMVNSAIASRRDLSDEQVDRLISKGNKDVSKVVAKRKTLQPHQIDALIPQLNAYGHKVLLKRKDLTKDHLEKIGKSKNANVKNLAQTRLNQGDYI